MIGEFNWTALSVDLEPSIGVYRSYMSQIMLIIWILLGTLLFANFIVTIMGAAQTEAEEQIQQYVTYKRLHVTRLKDAMPPSIPPPLQTLLPFCKYFWLVVFEPLIWLVSGRFINEEYLICKFGHWKDYKRQKYYSKKVISASLLKKPTFVRYNEFVQGRVSLPSSKNIFGRIRLLPRAWVEMKSGEFFIDSNIRERKQNNCPMVWICSYCWYVCFLS